MWKILKKPFEVFKKLYFGLNLFRHLSKKQGFLIFAVFLFIALIFPIHYAHAIAPILIGIGIIALIGAVAGVASGVTEFLVAKATEALTLLILVNAAIAVIIMFGAVHLQIGSWMFRWASGNPFGISMTNPATNKIIEIGWTVTRDLTNMFFILGLAYIGLATALNISGFNTKKTFVRLLLFALLINFTPVIAGVIVDAANIISNFFLSSIDLTTLYRAYETSTSSLGTVGKALMFAPTIWIKVAMFSLYAFIAGTVLWLFALLFLMRHFIIWFLVILSPLAFFAGIFDFAKAKEIYHKWWSHFISWSFIAVPAGFFVYLGHHLLTLLAKEQITTSIPTATGDANVIQRFLLDFSPYFVSAIFLCIGFFLTLKVNAAGSQIIIGAADRTIKKTVGLPKTLGQKLGKIAGQAAGSAVGAAAGGVVGGALAARQQHIAVGKEAGKNLWERQKGATKAAFRGAFTKEGREEGIKTMEENREKLYGWAERHHLAPAGTYEEQREKRLAVGEAQRRGQKMTEERINAQLAVEAKQPKHIAEQLGLIRAKIEEKQELTERDKQILLKHGDLDGGKTKWQAILGPRPDWEVILAPEKAQEKAIERLTGWTKEEREREHKRFIAEGATEEEAQEKIDQIERSAFKGSKTRTEAEAQLEEDRKKKLQEETQKIIIQGGAKGETIDDKFEKKAAKQAELNLKMGAPHIDQDIKIEITQERIDKMSDKKIGELQIDNLDLLMALDTKHIKTLSERATLKQLQKIDQLLTEDRAKGKESEFVQRVKWLNKQYKNTDLSEQKRNRYKEKMDRLLLMRRAVGTNDRFLYGGVGSKETEGEATGRQRRELEEIEETEAAAAEEERRREEEATAKKEREAP